LDSEELKGEVDEEGEANVWDDAALFAFVDRLRGAQ